MGQSDPRQLGRSTDAHVSNAAIGSRKCCIRAHTCYLSSEGGEERQSRLPCVRCVQRVFRKSATPSRASNDPNAPSGERRQVTALFVDMVGFTAISERLGAEGTFALIQPIYELMARVVREQGGSVKDFTGDGVMALFGAPMLWKTHRCGPAAQDWQYMSA